MAADDQMSPEASPAVVRRAGVRRVNNMPVYIVGGLVGVFLLVMMLVAADRAERQNRPPEPQPEKASNTSMFAREITGDRQGGIIQAELPKPPAIPELGKPLPEAIPAGGPPLPGALPTALPLPPAPMAAPAGLPANDDAERIRLAKLQMFEEAVKARPGVQNVSARSAASAAPAPAAGAPATRDETIARLAALRQQIDAQTRDDPTAAYRARLQQLQTAGLGSRSAVPGSGSAGPGLLAGVSSGKAGGKGYEQFDAAPKEDRWRLDSDTQAPRTPYELRAGFVIPATLISGINSDLPGQIIGQVSQDVFDTATGKYRLVPQGARLVGQYSSDVAYGQARILVAWQRIVFPDGKALDIGSMPGADAAGYAGLSDKVNNHYFRLFGSAFLMSGVTAGIALSQDRNNSGPFGTQQTTSGALSEALGQQLGQVTAQLISKNLSISPTLEIRPGYRFNVVVTKDMTFSRPYQPFDY